MHRVVYRTPGLDAFCLAACGSVQAPAPVVDDASVEAPAPMLDSARPDSLLADAPLVDAPASCALVETTGTVYLDDFVVS